MLSTATAHCARLKAGGRERALSGPACPPGVPLPELNCALAAGCASLGNAPPVLLASRLAARLQPAASRHKATTRERRAATKSDVLGQSPRFLTSREIHPRHLAPPQKGTIGQRGTEVRWKRKKAKFDAQKNANSIKGQRQPDSHALPSRVLLR